MDLNEAIKLYREEKITLEDVVKVAEKCENRAFNCVILQTLRDILILTPGITSEDLITFLYTFEYGSMYEFYVNTVKETKKILSELKEKQIQPARIRFSGKLATLMDINLLHEETLKVRITYYYVQGSVHQATEDVDPSVALAFKYRLERQKMQLEEESKPRSEEDIEKNRTLTEEERMWRINYYFRVTAKEIPKRRPCDADQDSSGTMWNLWNAKETRDEQFEEDYKKLMQTASRYTHRAKRINGKYYVLAFNYDTGLLEKREVDNINHKHLIPKIERIIDLIQGKPLPAPVSARAVPSKVKMTEKGKDKWIEKCPDYMKQWAIMLVKPKDENEVW